MLWFYESFFPVLWIAFIIYWRIKAVNTKTTQRLEPVASRILRALTFLIAIVLFSTTGWALALLAGSCRHGRRPSLRRLGASVPGRQLEQRSHD